jgi:small subunit ribosomal protein S6
VRKYELAVIIRADLSDEETTAQIETIQGWIESNGGSVLEIDRWGRRRLAYPIRKQQDGYYTLFKIELPPNAPTEIERNMHISESLLRYLITREGE